MKIDSLWGSPQFKKALFDVQTEESELYADNTDPVSFSSAFERRMARLMRAQRQPYYPLVNTNVKKALLALAAAFLLLATMVLSVSALREPVVQFFVEAYEKFSRVFFLQPQEEQFPAMLEVYYAPTWLPEGYQLDVGRTVDVIINRELTYVNKSGDEIVFRQHTITSSMHRIDTEGEQSRPIIINGTEGLIYSNREIQNLVWNNGQYGFLLFGPVAEADLLRMAGSVQVE